jgi:hypothetical protein
VLARFFSRVLAHQDPQGLPLRGALNADEQVTVWDAYMHEVNKGWRHRCLHFGLPPPHDAHGGGAGAAMLTGLGRACSVEAPASHASHPGASGRALQASRSASPAPVASAPPGEARTVAVPAKRRRTLPPRIAHRWTGINERLVRRRTDGGNAAPGDSDAAAAAAPLKRSASITRCQPGTGGALHEPQSPSASPGSASRWRRAAPLTREESAPCTLPAQTVPQAAAPLARKLSAPSALPAEVVPQGGFELSRAGRRSESWLPGRFVSPECVYEAAELVDFADAQLSKIYSFSIRRRHGGSCWIPPELAALRHALRFCEHCTGLINPTLGSSSLPGQVSLSLSVIGAADLACREQGRSLVACCACPRAHTCFECLQATPPQKTFEEAVHNLNRYCEITCSYDTNNNVHLKATLTLLAAGLMALHGVPSLPSVQASLERVSLALRFHLPRPPSCMHTRAHCGERSAFCFEQGVLITVCTHAQCLLLRAWRPVGRVHRGKPR